MLYLDAPIGPIKGLMIYRDHQDKGLFYYIPERPRLARNDGVPEFIYLVYKRDITDNPAFDPETKASLGGGFLAFTVDLGVDDQQLAEMKQELARFSDGEEVKLTPVQFHKGSVRLSISKDTADAPGTPPDQPKGLTFFEEVYGTTKPSLFGFNRATFSVVLSQEVAALFEAALQAGISPIGVIYDLEFLGLRPAFNVRITAEYKRIYDHLEIEFGARGQIYAVALALDIDLAFQKLRDDGSIKVEVLSFTDDANLRKQADDAFNWFKTELLKDFFKSSLEPPSFMKQTNTTDLVGRLQSIFQGLNSAQTSPTLNPVRGEPTKEPLTPAAPPKKQEDGMKSTADMNRAATQSGSESSGGGSGADRGISPFQIGFTLKYYRQEELKTRTFEFSEQAAVAREAAPQGLFTTMVQGLDLSRAIQHVNLDSDFFKRLITTVSASDEFTIAGISTLGVNLEYPGTRKPGEDPLFVDGFVYKSDDLKPRTFTTWLNDRKNLTYRYQMDIHFTPDSPWVGKEGSVTSDWIITRSRQLTLDPMNEISLFDVQLTLGNMISGQINQVEVELRYQDSANDFNTQKTFLLKPGDPVTHWKLRLMDSEQKTYQYRITYFLQEGVRVQTDWVSSEDPTLVVAEPFKGTLNIRMVPLLDPTTLLEADVELMYHEEDTGYTRRVEKVFSPSDLKGQQISIPTLAENPTSYNYTINIIRTDGSTYTLPPTTATTPVLVVSDGAGVTHRILVKLPSKDLSSFGLAALKVDLVGPGDDPDTASVLFTPSQTDDKMPALVQPGDGGTFTYSYKVTGYTTQGLPIEGDSGTSSGPTLIVKIPTR